MRTFNVFSAFLICLFFVSCTGAGEEKKDYSASMEVHKQAMEAETETVKILEQYVSNFGDLVSGNSIIGQLAPDKSKDLGNRLTSIQARLKDWQSNVIEVPGMEHNHGDGQTCNHSHAPAVDISPEAMLAAQESMNKEITNINRDMKTLFEMTMKSMESGFGEGEQAPE